MSAGSASEEEAMDAYVAACGGDPTTAILTLAHTHGVAVAWENRTTIESDLGRRLSHDEWELVKPYMEELDEWLSNSGGEDSISYWRYAVLERAGFRWDDTAETMVAPTGTPGTSANQQPSEISLDTPQGLLAKVAPLVSGAVAPRPPGWTITVANLHLANTGRVGGDLTITDPDGGEATVHFCSGPHDNFYAAAGRDQWDEVIPWGRLPVTPTGPVADQLGDATSDLMLLLDGVQDELLGTWLTRHGAAAARQVNHGLSLMPYSPST